MGIQRDSTTEVLCVASFEPPSTGADSTESCLALEVTICVDEIAIAVEQLGLVKAIRLLSGFQIAIRLNRGWKKHSL